MTTKIEVGDVVRLKQGTVAAVTAVEKGYINVSWKECGEWHTSYVNISEVEKLENLSKLIDNSKTVDSDRCSLESNTLKLIEQLVTGIEACGYPRVLLSLLAATLRCFLTRCSQQ